ncbi:MULTISPECIES: prephenate dehydratase [Inquilinus]|uniref:prephenate dehydratase n=1 Tax=Inquilinus ginsengisoli TaxID=363840 RepID=A0ABU1JM85_9PROT|nr:prephenate dehydratase [Inquilinus ginsengisoli]MDR6288679.1 prephenate dehydratase [Inquilinus ginsengisoli]
MSRAPTISFQGWPGANSDMAARQVYPNAQTVPCPSFEEALAAVHDGRADLAMIPIENSIAGRVADMHHLLPESGLHIVGEHFMRINHQLVALPGASLDGIREVHSHVQALGQCRQWLRVHGLKPVVHADTAGAARMVSELGDPGIAAISSRLAAEIYKLEILATDIEDAEHNTTRFVVLSRDPVRPKPDNGPVMTSFVFEVRSVPAALYKALGGFATNGVNIVKLESYMLGGRFNQTQFYADVDGHPDDSGLRFALEELQFFTRNFRLLGVYPAHPFRRDPSQAAVDA